MGFSNPPEYGNDLRDVLLTAVGMDSPWPFRDAVQELANFARQRLNAGYDGHGWEELSVALGVVQTTLDAARSDFQGFTAEEVLRKILGK